MESEGLAPKRLIGVSIVKNEADIVEAQIRHNLRYLDQVLVFDHDSTDATPAILRALVDEGLPVKLLGIAKAGSGFAQSGFTTTLANQAFDKHAADFVFPLDADEFIRVASRQALEQALVAADAEVMSMRWPTYVPDIGMALGHPLQTMRWRVEADKPPIAKIVVSRRVTATPNWFVGIGNHMLCRRTGNRLDWNTGDYLPGVALAHLPLRSTEQFTAKMLIGWLSRRLSGDQSGATTNNWHIRAMYERIVAGESMTLAHVRDYAIALYGLGCNPEDLSAVQFQLVDDPFIDLPPLRYTPENPVDPLQLLAKWTALLLDRMLSTPAQNPVALKTGTA